MTRMHELPPTQYPTRELARVGPDVLEYRPSRVYRWLGGCLVVTFAPMVLLGLLALPQSVLGGVALVAGGAPFALVGWFARSQPAVRFDKSADRLAVRSGWRRTDRPLADVVGVRLTNGPLQTDLDANTEYWTYPLHLLLRDGRLALSNDGDFDLTTERGRELAEFLEVPFTANAERRG